MWSEQNDDDFGNLWRKRTGKYTRPTRSSSSHPNNRHGSSSHPNTDSAQIWANIRAASGGGNGAMGTSNNVSNVGGVNTMGGNSMGGTNPSNMMAQASGSISGGTVTNISQANLYAHLKEISKANHESSNNGFTNTKNNPFGSNYGGVTSGYGNVNSGMHSQETSKRPMSAHNNHSTINSTVGISSTIGYNSNTSTPTHMGANSTNNMTQDNNPFSESNHVGGFRSRAPPPPQNMPVHNVPDDDEKEVPWWERLTTTKTGNFKGGQTLGKDIRSVRDDMDLKTRDERLRQRSTTNLHEGLPRVEYVSPRTADQFLNRRKISRPKSANLYASKRPML